MISFLLVPPAASADMGRADELFKKELYDEALKAYAELQKDPSEETSLKAAFRACESEALLFRFGDALTRFNALKLPKDPLWRSRFLILKAELYREYLQQYGGQVPTDVVEGDTDVFRRTPQEMRREVSAAYWELWKLKDVLSRRAITEESYFVDVAKADRGLYPTLLDFAALRWTEYLLQEAPEEADKPKPDAMSFIRQTFGMRLDAAAPPAELAGSLMEDAASLKGEGREQAREAWRIHRLRIPFESGHLVRAFKDPSAAAESAASVLERWMGEFKTPEGRAAAGFAAAELRQGASPDEAVRVCEKVAAGWSSTLGGQKCSRLLDQIRLPSLDVEARIVPPSGRKAVRVGTRNIKEVHFRLYATSPEDIKEMRPRGRGDHRTWSGLLNHPDHRLIEAFVTSRRPVRSWGVPVKFKSLYETTQTDVDLKDVEPGVYLVAVCADKSFEPGGALLYGAILNVTDLALVGSAGIEGFDRDLIFRRDGPRSVDLPAFHLYLLDALTGKAVPGADIAVRHGSYGNWQDADLKTDELGRVQMPMRVQLGLGQNSHHQLDPLARRKSSYAYWAGPTYAGHSVPPPYQLFIETDRPIYRPGQKVAFKVTVTERIPQGFKTYSGKASVELHARDVNGQELYQARQGVGAKGSFSGEFLIPTGRLLGDYHISAVLMEEGQHYGGHVSFAVEEYKRPEFEVTLQEAKGPWRFGSEAKVQGAVKYYFGGPVPDADVQYKVFRETYIPWFCWWWSWRSPGAGRTEIAQGRIRSGAEGDFSFSFTPLPRDVNEEEPLPARFTVEAEARDPGGRTIHASKTYVAGKKAYLFGITPSAGFASAGKAFPVEVKLMNLSEQAVSGEGSYVLFKLDKDPAPVEQEARWGGGFPPSPPLERIYKDVENGDEVRKGAVKFAAEKPCKLDLGALAPGAYRLTLRIQDPWGGETAQSIIVLCADPKGKKVPLKISSLSLPEHAEYAVGETALMLLGSSEISALTHIEVWGGQFLLSRHPVEGGGIRPFSLRLEEKHKGGVVVRWFGIKDFQPRSGMVGLSVPWKEKELDVRLKYDRVLKPGQSATWSLTVKDKAGRPATAEAAAKMYDRSLEYYAKGTEPRFENLYAPRPRPQEARGSLHAIYAAGIPVIRGWIRQLLESFNRAIEEPVAPCLRMNRSRIYGGYRMFDKMMGMAMPGAMASLAEDSSGGGMAMEKSMRAEGRSRSMMKADAAPAPQAAGPGKAAPAEPKVEIRSDFSETAFFKPHLKVSKGRAAFSFKAPEQLTSWRVTGNAVTSDVKVGRFSEEAATRKELMVRVDMPRFFREGDQGTLKAVVHNESEADLSGTLSLSVLEEGKAAHEKFGVKDLERDFTVKPHSLAAFSWSLDVPPGLGTFNIRAIARSGQRVDAEERELPILPSRQRLIESIVLALNGDADKTLLLKALGEKDPSRQSELLQLQVDPQLALTVLNSLPFLVQYPYECVEQTLNRYVPLAIVHAIYRKHPAIAAAAAKIPKRDTITPAWDREDPKRLTQLMESPWVEASKGRKSYWPVIDLFDTKVVAGQKEDAFKKLAAAQLPSGGFPWFPGGREDAYITLLVLAGLSEAQHYGVEAPPDMVQGALRYVMSELPRHLNPEPGDVSMLLYASYVITSFPEGLARTSLPELKDARVLVRKWLDYSDKQSKAMTQLGKAYAAYAYWRLGEKAKGDLYLRRAMEGAREEPATGVYWQPEKLSWLWYNDSLETHAFMIRLLQTVKPKDPRLPGLVQWLVFSRKGTEWKSTKASAAAVFALLDFMKGRGALDKGDSYAVSWGPVKDTAQVEPSDWLGKPLRWTQTGAEITPQYYKPRVQKRGPGLAFASLTYIYTTQMLAEESEEGLLNVRRLFFRRVKEGEDYHLKPLKSGDKVAVGDEIEVQLKVNTKSQFEYMHLKDPRGAGFEAEELRSGWKWDQLGRYEEPRDSLTNFFVSWLPHGEYILRYRVRPTTPGRYRIGAAVLQSMYSPEFAAHSAGFELNVGD
ncbi:MAG: alpha-2-macroglobulin family protein [Elusimicrobiota bacterium]